MSSVHKALLALLRRIEWNVWDNQNKAGKCPICGRNRPEYLGDPLHSTDCELHELIRVLEWEEA